MDRVIFDAADVAFRDTIRALLHEELGPRAAAIEARESWPEIAATIRALGDAGHLSVMFGARRRLTHATLVSEEAAYLNYAFEAALSTSICCAYPLSRVARPEVRDRYLPALLSGEAVGAIAVTEPGAGSNTAAMRTRVTFDARARSWVIDGSKRFITNIEVADCYIVYGVTDPAAPPQRGMSAVIVPKGAQGLTFPRAYHFMGRRGSVVGEVRFDGVRVPEDHLLSEVNAGYRVMTSMFNVERILVAGAALGVARSAFELVTAHAQASGLGRKQLVWDMVAEMSWRIDAAELLTYRAAKLYDHGLDGKELMKEAAEAKLVASEAAVFCADRTVQVLGGEGLTKEFGRAEQIYRDARALTIAGGTTEMAKYVIARADLPAIKPDL